MNSYFTDSHVLFKDLAKKISNNEVNTDMEAIQSTLLFALGIEKLLKGMLFDLNPLFILENAEFKR